MDGCKVEHYKEKKQKQIESLVILFFFKVELSLVHTYSVENVIL